MGKKQKKALAQEQKGIIDKIIHKFESRFHALLITKTRFIGHNYFYFIWQTEPDRYKVQCIYVCWTEGIRDTDISEYVLQDNLKQFMDKIVAPTTVDLTYEQGCSLLRYVYDLGKIDNKVRQDKRLNFLVRNGRPLHMHTLMDLFIRIGEPFTEDYMVCNAFIGAAMRNDVDALRTICPWLSTSEQKRWLKENNCQLLSMRYLGSETVLTGEAIRYSVAYSTGNDAYAMYLSLTAKCVQGAWSLNNILLDKQWKIKNEEAEFLYHMDFNITVYTVQGIQNLEDYFVQELDMRRMVPQTAWPCLMSMMDINPSKINYFVCERIQYVVMITDKEMAIMADPVTMIGLTTRLEKDLSQSLMFKYEFNMNNYDALSLTKQKDDTVEVMIQNTKLKRAFLHVQKRTKDEYMVCTLLDQMKRYFDNVFYSVFSEKAWKIYTQADLRANHHVLKEIFRAWFIFDYQTPGKTRYIEDYCRNEKSRLSTYHKDLAEHLQQVVFGVYQVDKTVSDKILRYKNIITNQVFDVVHMEGYGTIEQGDYVAQYLLQLGNAYYPVFIQLRVWPHDIALMRDYITKEWKGKIRRNPDYSMQAFLRDSSIDIQHKFCLDFIEEDAAEEVAAALEPILDWENEPSLMCTCEYMIVDQETFKLQLGSISEWMIEAPDGYVVQDRAGNTLGHIHLRDKIISINAESRQRMDQIRGLLDRNLRKSLSYMYEIEY